jgi:glutathione S-transferase
VELYTFTISHFSEKARWTLDACRIAYEERRLLPGAHVIRMRRLRTPGTTVPVLVDEDRVIQGSEAILDHVVQLRGGSRLAPPAELASRARELERRVDLAFGLGIQRIFYAVLMRERRQVVEMWTQRGPWWGRAFYAVTFPLAARRVAEMYQTSPEAVGEARAELRDAFEACERELADQRYLLGRLSRTDITVASLLAPLCRPPEHVLRWPSAMPDELAEFVRPFEGRPLWEYVRRLYREDRHARPAS